jgi:hypothetical protein
MDDSPPDIFIIPFEFSYLLNNNKLAFSGISNSRISTSRFLGQKSFICKENGVCWGDGGVGVFEIEGVMVEVGVCEFKLVEVSLICKENGVFGRDGGVGVFIIEGVIVEVGVCVFKLVEDSFIVVGLGIGNSDLTVTEEVGFSSFPPKEVQPLIANKAIEVNKSAENENRVTCFMTSQQFLLRYPYYSVIFITA